MSQSISGPAWDLSSEYPSLESNELQADFNQALSEVSQVEILARPIALALNGMEEHSPLDLETLVLKAQKIAVHRQNAYELLRNVITYASCVASVDAKNPEAKQWISLVQEAFSRFEQSIKPVNLFLDRVSDGLLKKYLSSPLTDPEAFSLKHSRELRPELLSLEEENLIAGLKVNGHIAWSNLYDTLSGLLICRVDLPEGSKELGIANATGLLHDTNEAVRKAAWTAITLAWKSQEEVCASMLNALAGWRLEVNRRRSHTRKVHFLDSPLHDSRIKRETLQAIWTAVDQGKDLGQRALILKARALGKAQLDPWDLFAPNPVRDTDASAPTYSFDEAMEVVVNAFRTVHPEFADFALLMQKNRWIEGRTEGNKRAGAYCTRFSKSRTPRVYMTYTGCMSNVRTLAHEIGHAYHSWVMRDLPFVQTSYPMTLAETASIFAETVVGDAFEAKASTRAERFQIGWSDAESAAGFLINIPARFDFEQAFYEQRETKILSPEEFSNLNEACWKKRYGNTLSQVDSMFWASKLHFYISSLSFYNFPYTFGYLFSLGIYARREKDPQGFFPAYVSLLRDTGRMTAEEVARKHLGVDLTCPDFWLDSISIIRRKIERFESYFNTVD